MNIGTKFLSAERADKEIIKKDFEYFSNQPLLLKVVDSTPDPILILNKERQTVFCNKSLLSLVHKNEIIEVLSQRPGELLQCAHAMETKTGCGTTEFCTTCGAAQAILSSHKGKNDIKECRISTTCGTSLDLKVWTTPFTINENFFTIFSFLDISNEKRKRALERIFFHDVLNTAGGIFGFAEILKEATEEEIDEFSGIIHSLSSRLIEEINTQKDLTAAENDELQVTIDEVSTDEIIRETIETYLKHEVVKQKEIKYVEGNNVIIKSDKVLLRRVLGNLLKNALEATLSGGEVSIGCKIKNSAVSFFVHNPSFIPRPIQLQIFQRSFSTKGSGRGLGTYSIKLLTEQYLKGKVSFVTSEIDGTTFFIELPVVN